MNKLDILKELSKMRNTYQELENKIFGSDKGHKAEALDWAIKCVSKAPEPLEEPEPEEDPNWRMHAEDWR